MLTRQRSRIKRTASANLPSPGGMKRQSSARRTLGPASNDLQPSGEVAKQRDGWREGSLVPSDATAANAQHPKHPKLAGELDVMLAGRGLAMIRSGDGVVEVEQ